MAMQLSEWMERAGVETPDFAKRIGISDSHLYLLRSGKRRPSLELLRIIERETNGAVTVDDWLLVPSKRGSKRTDPSSSGGPKKKQRGAVKNAAGI